MQQENRKLNPLLIIFTALTFYALFIFRDISEIKNQNSPALLIENIIPIVKAITMPTRIKIPAIKLNASIESVGIADSGAMDIPKIATNAAWFNLGKIPGEKGSAVIAGHYGWKNGLQAAFDNLHKLKKGDLIYVEDSTGMMATFFVTEIKKYDKDDDTSTIFGSSDNKEHLNLITCAGFWNKNNKSYSKRLVVFTEKKD